jgi:hypothetical protein
LVRPIGLEPITFGSGVIALHESLLFGLVEQHLEEFPRLYEEGSPRYTALAPK